MKYPQTLLVYAATWLALVIVTAAALSPGLNSGFFFDDEPNIVRNKAIQVNELSLDTLLDSTTGPSAGPLGRPVSVASFAITHFFFGLDPYAFKATNVGLHILNGLLIAWLVALLLQLFKSQLTPEERIWVSIWVSGLWLIHPINVLPTMLAVQRMTLLSGLFLLLAFITHIKAITATGSRKWVFYVLAWVLFWPMAIFSKETGLLFPVYVLLLSFFLPSRLGQRYQTFAFLAALLAAIVLGMLYHLGWDWLRDAYLMRPFTLAERLMTEARVLWFYAGQIVIPEFEDFAIYLDYFAVSKSLTHPWTTLISIVAWTAVGLIILLYRNRLPLLCFTIGWFLVGHSLESSFLPLEIAHEYRNYIPSIGLIFAIGYLGAVGLHKLKLDYKKTITGIVAISPLFILALFTWLRSEQLSNPILGSQIEAARHPLSARANYTAAVSLFQSGYGDIGNPLGGKQIQYHFQQAGRVDPSFKHGYLGLIAWACASGRKLDDQWIDEFASRLRHTPFSPSEGELPNEILKILLNIPTCLSREKALDFFIKGSENPRVNQALKAKFLEAASDYELLVSLNPSSAYNLLSKAVATWPHNAILNKKLKSYRFLEHMQPLN